VVSSGEIVPTDEPIMAPAMPPSSIWRSPCNFSDARSSPLAGRFLLASVVLK
jgi:hypothetical protein